MTIINFDDIIGKKFNTITNNIFCLSHPKNSFDNWSYFSLGNQI